MRRHLAVSFHNYASLLEFALKDGLSAIIVVCFSRDVFLQRLRDECDAGDSVAKSLLVPSLQLITKSTGVSITFVSDYVHLCAHLSLITSRGSGRSREGPDTRPLVLIGLVDVLRESGRLNAQILMKTCAAAVDAASSSRRQLLVAERVGTVAGATTEAEGPPETNERPVWAEEIPMLEGSVRLGGYHTEWTSRTVHIGRVFGRWCDLTNLESLLAD